MRFWRLFFPPCCWRGGGGVGLACSNGHNVTFRRKTTGDSKGFFWRCSRRFSPSNFYFSLGDIVLNWHSVRVNHQLFRQKLTY